MEYLKNLTLTDYPHQTFDKIRYRDTDRQGHVNNAVFSTFIETGRLEMMFHPDHNLADDDTFFVIVKVDMDLVSEITWPGKIDIGTGVKRIGNSSVELVQGIYQDHRLVAVAKTVIVQMGATTRKSKPLLESSKEQLKKWMMEINEK